jgi:hypothetical protein
MLALMSSDEANWHSSTIEAIKSGKPAGQDTASLLLARLGGMEKKDDVSCRVFRNVLGYYIKQNGLSAVEGEAWLNFAVRASDSRESTFL